MLSVILGFVCFFGLRKARNFTEALALLWFRLILCVPWLNNFSGFDSKNEAFDFYGFTRAKIDE